MGWIVPKRDRIIWLDVPAEHTEELDIAGERVPDKYSVLPDGDGVRFGLRRVTFGRLQELRSAAFDAHARSKEMTEETFHEAHPSQSEAKPRIKSRRVIPVVSPGSETAVSRTFFLSVFHEAVAAWEGPESTPGTPMPCDKPSREQVADVRWGVVRWVADRVHSFAELEAEDDRQEVDRESGFCGPASEADVPAPGMAGREGVPDGVQPVRNGVPAPVRTAV